MSDTTSLQQVCGSGVVRNDEARLQFVVAHEPLRPLRPEEVTQAPGLIHDTLQDFEEEVATEKVVLLSVYEAHANLKREDSAELKGRHKYFMTDQPISNCGHSASHETCVARFSSWTYCWLSA